MFSMMTGMIGRRCATGAVGLGFIRGDQVDDVHSFDDAAEYRVTPAALGRVFDGVQVSGLGVVGDIVDDIDIELGAG